MQRACATPGHDREFARVDAAREAGTYLDTDNLQVFKGEGNSCRDRLFKDCCESDSAGKGMSNQSLMGAGSRLVFDILMNADNRDFLYQGMSALLTSGGFSGSFTSYGVTVAVNGTALPAGSAVLFSGESVVIAFDPWSLAIAVVMYAVTSLASCNEGEAKLAMKEGAGLCHAIGSYCSSCIRILGHCVSCIEHTTGKCCFNSVLARVINEQGRVQFAPCHCIVNGTTVTLHRARHVIGALGTSFDLERIDAYLDQALHMLDGAQVLAVSGEREAAWPPRFRDLLRDGPRIPHRVHRRIVVTRESDLVRATSGGHFVLLVPWAWASCAASCHGLSRWNRTLPNG